MNITILGATGSIGQNTLDIIARHPDKFSVFAISANTNHEKLFVLCQRFKPKFAVLVDDVAAKKLSDQLKSNSMSTEVLAGTAALEFVASAPEVDRVMTGIVGSAGLKSSLAAAKAGKTILLANKESLVMSGKLFMDAVKQHSAQILPTDSEHNAIFQCLPESYVCGQTPENLSGITLTASGGPFLNTSRSDLQTVTPEKACAHPTWKMGRKISIDSATMMNKGLEIIEAHYLFNLPLDEIEVLIHPQSIVHGFLRFKDGSSIAQFGPHDMRVPISYCLAWPERIASGAKALDVEAMANLSFQAVAADRFPCFNLALQAAKAGDAAQIILNVANEVAVQAFLDGRIAYLEIPKLIEAALEKVESMTINSIDDVLSLDQQTRDCLADSVIV